MLNKLHALLHSPHRGWDPITEEHARSYSIEEWKKFNFQIVDQLETKLHGLSGKRVLDLGGGPGQYSIAFAKRGAHVVWHDISARYRKITQQKAVSEQVAIEYSLGYLEESRELPTSSFDLIFCRICWYYCQDDQGFADIIYSLLKPGGLAYIDVITSRSLPAGQTFSIRQQLYHLTGYKIGHPPPKPGLVPGLFLRFPLSSISVQYNEAGNETISLVKAEASGSTEEAIE